MESISTFDVVKTTEAPPPLPSEVPEPDEPSAPAELVPQRSAHFDDNDDASLQLVLQEVR